MMRSTRLLSSSPRTRPRSGGLEQSEGWERSGNASGLIDAINTALTPAPRANADGTKTETPAKRRGSGGRITEGPVAHGSGGIRVAAKVPGDERRHRQGLPPKEKTPKSPRFRLAAARCSAIRRCRLVRGEIALRYDPGQGHPGAVSLRRQPIATDARPAWPVAPAAMRGGRRIARRDRPAV